MRNANSSPALTNVTFTGNQAATGGGIENFESSPTLTNVTFTGNQATINGGGMFNTAFGGPESNPTLTNVTFDGNQARWGGGMRNANGSSAALTNVTFAGNQATDMGGGMYNSESSPTLVNAILWGNAAPTGPQIHNSGDSAPSVTYCLVEGGHAGEGNIDADPLFVDPISADEAPTAAGNYRLSEGSPAIDAGTNDAVTVHTDLDGNPRIVDGTGDGNAIVDMGAYEFGAGLRTVYLPLVLSNR